MEKEVIAAIRSTEEFESALSMDMKIVFDLSPDLLNVAGRVKKLTMPERSSLYILTLLRESARMKAVFLFLRV